ncbi:hypothetical protein [Brevundimonas sp. UBA2416]|uniref:hypothetical protein n=1 Tax=Brevundimonas sp. UBA2416 TaxID=1946124 RepID=UPI0025C32F04|nr:hypothetical protein [Brevundimonas sp. UBA2416]HRJ63386.1 hypothetical protein [Brevundimonas sp.]
MLSPLRPLLCRHEFYWSERHQSDLCRRCGKTRVASEPASAEAMPAAGVRNVEVPFLIDDQDVAGPLNSAFFDIPASDGSMPEPKVPVRRTPSAKALKAQALERRENLLALLDRIAEGGQPSRKDSLDVILAVIEDAHSADPVLFGQEAAGHFARLHDARSGLIF